MGEPVLWHIEVSHYNEKVRWALDYKGVSHTRRAPLPGVLHPVVALAKSGKPFLPILDLEGESIADSTRIIEELERRWPEPPLYPADPAERARALELEDYFDEQVAPDMRRLLFWEMSRDGERSAEGLRLFGVPVPPGPLARMFVAGIARRYGGEAGEMENARAKGRAGFERVLAEVGPSGYLVGDSFTIADLTAASILYHLAEPPDFQYATPTFPDSVYTFRDSLPPESLEWIRRMWREHRGVNAAVPG
jgi:glutathione S-transferase